MIHPLVPAWRMKQIEVYSKVLYLQQQVAWHERTHSKYLDMRLVTVAQLLTFIWDSKENICLWILYLLK